MQRTTFPFLKTYRSGNHVKWLSSGEPYFKELLRIIHHAKEVLHLQFYIFDDDEIGREVMQALMEAAKRGVEVFVVVDAFGSNGLGKKKEMEMKKEGIHFRRFAPIVEKKFIFIGRRLHHKIVVADNHTALVGGINIADKYRGNGEPAWVDFAVRVEGDLCFNLTKICFRIWNKQFEAKLRLRRERLPKIQHLAEGHPLIRIRENDWLRGKKQITRSHRQAFRSANKSIIIVGSYFIPGIKYRNLLKNAARRGVKIQILLTDISDVPLVKNGTRYLYRFLLRNRIEFYEINDRILHGKAVVVDGIWTTIGSYNIDDLSVYNNVECNIDILDAAFAKDFGNHILDLMKHQSKEITKENYEQSYKIWNQFYDWCVYQLLRLIAKVLLFFTHKVKSDEE